MYAASNGHTETAIKLKDMGAEVAWIKWPALVSLAHDNSETVSAINKIYYKKLKSTCYKLALPVIFGFGSYLVGPEEPLFKNIDFNS